MTAAIFLALVAGGAVKVPTLDALLEAERTAPSLPCNVENTLYVPDDAEVSYLKAHAATVLEDELRELRVAMLARVIIRKHLQAAPKTAHGTPKLSCMDIVGIHDAALEEAENRVP